MTHPLIDQLERDIAQVARNQVLIDRMKTFKPQGKFMVYARTHIRQLLLLLNFIIVALVIFGAVKAFAAECPDPGVKCKVLFLSEQEERMLMGQNGILDTAAQARALDLGQFAVYLKTRIGSAPAGEVKPVKPAPDNNVAQPTDKPVDK